MKYSLSVIILFMLGVTGVVAQQKMISQAIVSTTTNVIAPEEDETMNPGAGGGRMNFANMMDGETKSTTWIKDDMVKTLLKSDVMRSTVFRNNSTKITTTLMEVMGNKIGFFVTDSEQTELKKKTDSIMQSRRNADSNSVKRQTAGDPVVEMIDAGETKKISGYQCKKAYLLTTRLPGIKDTMTVWYTPELKLKNTNSTGGLSAFGSMAGIGGLDKIDGFVMRYEMNMRRGRRMEVEVTKIDLAKEISDKEFEIPKDFDIKPMKEMQNFFGGRGGFGMPSRP